MLSLFAFPLQSSYRGFLPVRAMMGLSGVRAARCI